MLDRLGFGLRGTFSFSLTLELSGVVLMEVMLLDISDSGFDDLTSCFCSSSLLSVVNLGRFSGGPGEGDVLLAWLSFISASHGALCFSHSLSFGFTSEVSVSDDVDVVSSDTMSRFRGSTGTLPFGRGGSSSLNTILGGRLPAEKKIRIFQETGMEVSTTLKLMNWFISISNELTTIWITTLHLIFIPKIENKVK